MTCYVMHTTGIHTFDEDERTFSIAVMVNSGRISLDTYDFKLL
jgi:hypothetical protein